MEDINSNFNKEKSWNEIMTHSFSIKKLAQTESKMVNRLHVLEYFYVQFNIDCTQDIFDDHVLKWIDQKDWGKIIAIKIFRRKSEIPSFDKKHWEKKIDFNILKIVFLTKPNKFMTGKDLIWGLANIPFYPINEDIDETKFRQNTLASIEQSLAILRQTKSTLTTQRIFNYHVKESDRKIINKVSNSRLKVFTTKALSSKLCTPLTLRFNPWYPNLKSKIIEWDIKKTKSLNPIRRCPVPNCNRIFNNNHVFDGSCLLYNQNYWAEIKLIWFTFFISISQQKSTSLSNFSIPGIHIINLLEHDESWKQIKSKTKNNTQQMIFSERNIDAKLVVSGFTGNKFLYIYTLNVVLNEKIIQQLWLLMASLLCFNATFFVPKKQSFEELGFNFYRNVQQHIQVLIPWMYSDQSHYPIEFFGITYKPHFRYFNKELAILGQIPFWFSKLISSLFNQNRKKILAHLVLVSKQITRKSSNIYKKQLKFFRTLRLKFGIRKVNPYKIDTPMMLAACPRCSKTNTGPLCKGHEKRRKYLYKRAIKYKLIEPHTLSTLIAAFLSASWLQLNSRKQNHLIKESLQFLRKISQITETPIYEIRSITVTRLKRSLDLSIWKDTNIGLIDDFFPPNQIGNIDLPFYYVRRHQSLGDHLDIGFPVLFKWEIKCLIKSEVNQLNIKQLELLNNKIIKFLQITPIRSIKGPETFKSPSDLINRTMWFQSNFKNNTVWRILSCSYIDADGNFIFMDDQHDEFPQIEITFSLEQIKERGFIYVGT
jgi:hypothetical protein